ncbi:MAG: phage terminase large subunit [Candidatus Kapaibacteriota bacterium]
MKYTPSDIGKLIFKSKWSEPKHIEVLNRLLVEVTKRNIHRLVVNLPPRYGKSTLISLLYPFWYIGNYPQHNLMLVTYQNKLAQLWGKRIRQLIFAKGKELFEIELDKEDRSSSTMTIFNHNGRILCVGAGGLLTGLGADAIIVDDPIKNQKEALSLHQRESLWEWFKATLFTRLEPNGVLLIVCTRWHEDDLVGRLLSTQDFVELSKKELEEATLVLSPAKWCLLKIPAIANENDPLGRAPGEVLWKERFDYNSLQEQRKFLGDFWFSALYQQEPIFKTGKIFKRENFRYFELKENNVIVVETKGSQSVREYHLLEHCTVFTTVDLAVKANERTDYTVGIVFAVNRSRDIFILEIIRERFNSADHLSLLWSVFSRWKPVLIGIEAVQYQYSLIQMGRKMGLPVKELKADRDKIARSLSIANLVDSGKVYFRKGASWLDDFERELIEFPDSKHDDQVDAFSYISQIIEPISSAKVHSAPRKKYKDILPLFE